MSKKTLALILILLALTVLLVVIALITRNSGKTTDTGTQTPQSSTTTTPAPVIGNTVLSMSPNPVTTATAGSASATADVLINTNGDLVTAIQLEIAYDPKVLTNMRVAPGNFFSTPNVLPVGGVNAQTGRITFMLVPSNIREAKNGTGTVATLTFTPNRAAGVSQTPITILEKSLVSARGQTLSVLKSYTGTTVNISPLTQPQTGTGSAQ